MQAIPETVTISDLKRDQASVLERVGTKPLLLTQLGRPAAVMVAPEEWNKIADRLASYEQKERNQIATEALRRMKNGQAEVDYFVYRSPKQIDALIDANPY